MNIKLWLYRMVRRMVKAVYPKIKVEGTENLPEEPVIMVGNHCQMHGPIAAELYAPDNPYTWCAWEMMHLKEVPDYAFRDFWSEKPACIRFIYRAASYVIAPLSVVVFNNARTIGVYHDSRILSTLKTTVKRMEEGNSIVIFPEGKEPYNPILNRFRTGFVDAARLYYKRTGKKAAFVPIYLAPSLRTMYIGKPVRYDPENPADEERTRICTYLMDQITRMAVSLPRHRVVPYRNIPKSQYPYNISQEAAHETACS